MHARLVASALQVFASKGFDATDIEDVIAAAEVSRGTFYNYFKTNEELMQAVIEAVSHEMLTLIDAVVLPKPDPASRIASGLRLVLHTTCRHRLFANFVTRMGVDQTLRHSLAIQYLQRDLQAGMDEGRFAMKDARLGLLLVLGTAHATIMAWTCAASTLTTPAWLPLAVVGTHPNTDRPGWIPLTSVPMRTTTPEKSLPSTS